MTFLIVIGSIFIIWLVVANINSYNEGKRQMRESAWINHIKEKYPEAYKEYFTWEARQRHGRDMKPIVMQWDDKRWEVENARLITKKTQKIRSEREEKWAKEQFDFAENCVAIAKRTMPGFGYYKYTTKVSTISNNGVPTNMDMLVWQHFPDSLCLDDQLDYTNVQYAKNNLDNLQEFKERKRHFYDTVYSKIVAFVKELQKDGNVLIYLNYNINGWTAEALTYHYNAIIDALGTDHIVTSSSNLPVGEDYKHWEKRLERKLVVIDMMTDNNWIKWNCTHVFENLREKFPLIAYISLLKCFDRQEMLDIIAKANADAEKKAEEQRAIEEEKQRIEKLKDEKRKEFEAAIAKHKAKELAEKKKKEEERAKLQATAKDVLVRKAKSWDKLYLNFHYTWLFYYYPTTCDFEASNEEWENRWRVWNFKNDPEKGIEEEEHEGALDDLIPRIKQRLNETFGEDYLQFLTLVCLPASTKVKNAARYEDFANRLCKETGMENGYEHTHIVKDGMSKNHPNNQTNHSIQPLIEFDKDFFKNKYVLLFDDVVTKGGTMLRYKEIMEGMKALVIGGFCLGKTKHERPERQRFVSFDENEFEEGASPFQ